MRKEELYSTCYANLNLPVHEMTEKMLFIAVAVNHAITVTLVKPISYSAQENTSTNKLQDAKEGQWQNRTCKEYKNKYQLEWKKECK